MKISKKVIGWFSFAVVLIVLLVVTVVPLPYYIEGVGGAADVRQVLTVNDKPDEEGGSYNFVYVSVRQATAIQLLKAKLDPHADIYTAEEMTGGSDNEEYNLMNQVYMQTSQNMATYQALKIAGESVSMDFKGVYVMSVAEDSTFKNQLQVGDTVTSVNGKHFDNSQDFISYVSKLKLDSSVTIGYTHDGKKQTADGRIIKLSNGKNGIGISLTDHTEISEPGKDKIDFQTGNIGGPSAGLMFTLAIYTQLHDPDLRDGRMIAGTGTIEKDGTVGEIGGIDKKVLSADRAGAKIFFAPDNDLPEEYLKANPDAKNNYQVALATAKKEKLRIKVVPVKTAQDAIDYLEKTKSE